jgi:hypothetical protein
MSPIEKVLSRTHREFGIRGFAKRAHAARSNSRDLGTTQSLKPTTRVVRAKLPLHVAAQLEADAKAYGRSISVQAERILREYFQARRESTKLWNIESVTKRDRKPRA